MTDEDIDRQQSDLLYGDHVRGRPGEGGYAVCGPYGEPRPHDWRQFLVGFAECRYCLRQIARGGYEASGVYNNHEEGR